MQQKVLTWSYDGIDYLGTQLKDYIETKCIDGWYVNQILPMVQQEYGGELNSWVVFEGFHSWKKRPVCRWTVNRGHHRIFKFIIPKGATYYEGIQHDDEQGYVSDKIIMKNCAYYTGFWSFLNSFLVR